MKIPFKQILNIVGVFVPAVGAATAIVEQLPGLKGKQKQDAAIELVKQTLAGAEQVTDKDLLDDADLEQAARGVVDAVVAFQNMVKKKKG